MNPSASTIRLQNRSLTNISLHLHQLRAPASPGLRRALALTPINIPAGQYYDMCLQLSCSVEEAQRILDNSHEVRHFEAGGRLIVMPWPPPAEVAAPAVASRAEPAPEALAETPILEPDAIVEDAPTPVPEPETPMTASVADAVAPDEPSMDWSEDQLRDYAKKHRIDLSKAKSKSAILRTIRMGR